MLHVLAAAICAAVTLGIFLAYGRPPAMSDVVISFCALAVFIAAVGLFTPDQVWTLDEDTVAVRKRAAFYLYTRSWPMREVTSVRVRETDGEEPADTFYIELRLASGKRLRLPTRKGRDGCDEIAEQIEARTKSV